MQNELINLPCLTPIFDKLNTVNRVPKNSVHFFMQDKFVCSYDFISPPLCGLTNNYVIFKWRIPCCSLLFVTVYVYVKSCC